MKIRRATLEDLEKIRSLNKMHFSYDCRFDSLNMGWPESEHFDRYFKHAIKSGFAALAEEGGAPVGYMAGLIRDEPWHSKPRVAEIGMIYVLPERRGKGTGTAMLKEFKKWAKSEGAQRIKVMVYYENRLATEFYGKNGLSPKLLVLEENI